MRCGRATLRRYSRATGCAAAPPGAGTLPRVSCRAITFDFNGTLSDDEAILYEIYAGLFAEQDSQSVDGLDLRCFQ